MACDLLAKVIYGIGTEIIFLKYSGREADESVKYRTPENGKHMYQYLRIESCLNPVSKRDLFKASSKRIILASQVGFSWNHVPGGPTTSRRLSFVRIVDM